MKEIDKTQNKTKHMITMLSNPYVSVGGSFGGNQSWFETLENKKRGERIRDYGCGLIAVGDIILYITGYDIINETAAIKSEGKQTVVSGAELDSETYRDYILSIEKKFFHVLPKMGISGPVLSWGMNLYFWMHRKEIKKITGSKYHSRWFVRPKKLLERIKEMLSNDIPVLFSVGPGFFHKDRLPLYNKTQEAGKLIFKPVQRTKDHYMIITGVLEGEKTMLEISSWGTKYYISFDEYKKYIKKCDNYLFSNILYIKKR